MHINPQSKDIMRIAGIKSSPYKTMFFTIAIAMCSGVSSAQNLLENAISYDSGNYNSVEAFYAQGWIACDAEGNRIEPQTSAQSVFSPINANLTVQYLTQTLSFTGNFSTNEYLQPNMPVAVLSYPYDKDNPEKDLLNYNFPVEVSEEGDYIFSCGMLRLSGIKKYQANDPLPAKGWLVIVASDDLNRKNIELKQDESGNNYMSVTDSAGEKCNFIYSYVPGSGDAVGSISGMKLRLKPSTKYITIYGPSWLPALGNLSLTRLFTGSVETSDLVTDSIAFPTYYDLQGRQLKSAEGICIEKRGNSSRLIRK